MPLPTFRREVITTKHHQHIIMDICDRCLWTCYAPDSPTGLLALRAAERAHQYHSACPDAARSWTPDRHRFCIPLVA